MFLWWSESRDIDVCLSERVYGLAEDSLDLTIYIGKSVKDQRIDGSRRKIFKFSMQARTWPPVSNLSRLIR